MPFTKSIRIANIAGIEIAVDLSWFVIFLLVTWNLASVFFPAIYPNSSVAAYWILSVIGTLLFFLSLLVHELAHALVARRRGLRVSRITLFIFGGVANIERNPATAKTEFLMAIVGPLTSFAIGVLALLGGMSGISHLSSASTDVVSFGTVSPVFLLLFWLGLVNVMVAVFNLLPGFPLDGGRVLRSVLWAITHNVSRATRYAARVGQVFAGLFIALGVLMIFGVTIPVFGTGLFSGMWLVLVGSFLMQAAALSYEQVLMEIQLSTIPVGEVMDSHYPRVSPDSTLASIMEHTRYSTYPEAFVVERLPGGMLYTQDIQRLPREQWEHTLVKDVQIPFDSFDCITLAEQALDAFLKMKRAGRNVLPVIEDGAVVGLIRLSTILTRLQRTASSYAYKRRPAT